MKTLMIGLTILSCTFTGWCEVFRMDRKGEATVEVEKTGGEYRVTCRFRPQTKFDKAVNARFNDAKGDSLCKKGLARFLKVSADETLTLAGMYSVAPVQTDGDRLCYSFGVPVSGCHVAKSGCRPKPPEVTEKPAAVASATLPAVSKVIPVRGNQGIQNKGAMRSKTAEVVSSSAYVCVSRYKEVNGTRTTISQREYQGRDFKSPREFEQFCQQEFARIRALGEANLRAVRNFGK